MINPPEARVRLRMRDDKATGGRTNPGDLYDRAIAHHGGVNVSHAVYANDGADCVLREPVGHGRAEVGRPGLV